MKIIIGDSIAQGCWAPNGGWADLLKKHFSEEEELVYNLSVDGATVIDVFARTSELPERIQKDEPLDIILALGANDTAMISSDKFKFMYSELISRLKSYQPRNIYCIGLTYVDEKHSAPVAWNKDLKYFNHKMHEFNSIIRNSCLIPTDVEYIHVIELLDNNDLHDGVHPNDIGHKKLFNQIIKYIK